ncbi:MAG TPA: serine O-acetyltransferase [bacterium]|nr:serine O-acetyltransferase [bacterium]
MFKRLREDVKAIFEKDPAARGALEVLLCYPGLHALIAHRFAHFLHARNVPLLPRLISHVARFFTGVEIHPGAKLGRGVVIDHGMGVVIGETAEIGDGVLIYQGVSLGGVSLERGKRHPTIEKNVVIGAGAKVLGPITIGEGSLIGSGAVVVKPVPAGSTVVGIPGRIIASERLRAVGPAGEILPDPDTMVLQCVLRRLEQLEKHAGYDCEQKADDRHKECVFHQDGVSDLGQCLSSR